MNTPMLLPNGDRAFIDPAKLIRYALNANHEVGKHKALVFRAALGMTAEHALWLASALLDAARTQPAQLGVENSFGRRFIVDFSMEGPGGTAVVRSCWIIRRDEDFPRLTSVYVK